MAKPAAIHWVAPASMLGGLIAGTLLATGHHLFYSRLGGTAVSESIILGSISYQEANTAAGTALAYLVKSCLVFSVAAAFVQVFWKEYEVVLRRAERAPHLPKIKHLDSLYSAQQNVFMLLKILLWSKYPCLFFLAALTWVIPIPSVITPATLTICSELVNPAPVFPKNVSSVDFTSLGFVAYMPLDVAIPKPASYFYTGPHSAVMNVVNAAMSQGSILQIPSPGSNASWAVEFLGPSLQCEEVSDATKFRFLNNTIRAYNAKNLSETPGLELPLYLSWLPSSFWPRVTDLPFPFVDEDGDSRREFSPNVITSINVQGDVAEFTLYIMTIPNTQELLNWPNPSNISTTIEKAKERYTGTALACRMYNSTYRVSFEDREGVQNVSIELSNIDTAPQEGPIITITGPELDFNTTAGTSNFVLPQICLGSADPPPQNHCGQVNRALLRSLSYQAVFDAVSQSIEGLIDDVWDSADASIKDTALMDNHELRFLRQQGSMWGPSLQEAAFSFNNEEEMRGLSNRFQNNAEQPLARALEEVFRNLTVSLMSSPMLQPNASSITAPSPANVTLHRYHNVYSYSAWKLWVAYGIAILLNLVAAGIGFAAMLSNGVSYSDNFSTILRRSRGAEISVVIQTRDLDGRDPVPAYLKEARIWFPRRGNPEAGNYVRQTERSALMDGENGINLADMRSSTRGAS